MTTRSYWPLPAIACCALATLLSGCIREAPLTTKNGSTTTSSNVFSAVADNTAQTLTVGMAMPAFTPLVSVSGGTPPYSYVVSNGVLPDGLTLDPASGVVSGTPTTTQSANAVDFMVRDANSLIAAVGASVLFNVGAASPNIVANAVANSLAVYRGLSVYSFSPLIPNGGQPPYHYVLTSGTLPAGLSLNASTGAITGTPSDLAVSSSVTLAVSDAAPSTASTSASVAINVQPLPAGYILQGGLTWMPAGSNTFTYPQAQSLCAGTILDENGWRLPSSAEAQAFYAAYPGGSSTLISAGWTLSNGIWTSTAYDVGHLLVSLLNPPANVWWAPSAQSMGVTCVH